MDWKRAKWWIVFGVVIALALGAVTVAFLMRGDKSDSASGTTTTTSVATADWFGSQQTAACPALKRVRSSTVLNYRVIYGAALGGLTWPEAQTASTELLTSLSDSAKQLTPFATPAAQAELGALQVYLGRLGDVVKASPSAAEYYKGSALLRQGSPNGSADLAKLFKLADACIAAA